MAARPEGSRQRLGQNSLIVADDKFHLPLPPQAASRAGAKVKPRSKGCPCPIPSPNRFSDTPAQRHCSYRLISGFKLIHGNVQLSSVFVSLRDRKVAGRSGS